jgi:hypothetical protein
MISLLCHVPSAFSGREELAVGDFGRATLEPRKLHAVTSFCSSYHDFPFVSHTWLKNHGQLFSLEGDW